HLNRDEELFRQAVKFGKMGGYIDLTYILRVHKVIGYICYPASSVKLAFFE
ncbi:unnamed protein product, partial [marine sediment metagenome]